MVCGIRGRYLVVLLWVLCHLPGAEARQLQIEGMTAEDMTGLAAGMMAAGRLQDAALVLDQLEQDDAGGVEREVLQARLAVAQGNFHIAIDRYQAVLERTPGMALVRLELAQVLFANGDDDAADDYFRLVLEDNPAEDVSMMVNRYRDIIRQRRPWNFQAGMSVIPDSNINGATSRETVDLFGLPFELENASRSRSGVGLAVNFQGNYRFFRAAKTPLYTGAYGRLLHFGHSEFNDDYLGAEAGPEFLTPVGRLRVSLSASQRWYGNETYQTGLGSRVVLESPLAEKWALGGSLDVRNLQHPQRAYLNGWEYTGQLTLSRPLGPVTLGSAWLGLRRQSADNPGYANSGVRLGLGVSREMEWGLRGNLAVDVGRTEYDQAVAAYGGRRGDHNYLVSLGLFKRDWNFHGFAPSIQLLYSKGDSTVDLYESSRWRAEFGLAKVF